MLKAELGVSTGLAYRGMGLSEAVRAAKSELGDHLKVVELCPQDKMPEQAEIRELKKIMEGEGLRYSVHADRQFSYHPEFLKERFLDFICHNTPAMLLSESLEADHVVIHPSIELEGKIPDEVRRKSLRKLSKIAPTVPIVIESGVIRRDKSGEIISYEEGRTPEDLLPYTSCPEISGLVVDVPKMSRSWERVDENLRNKDFITRYIGECRRMNLPIREVQFVDVESFSDAQDFNELTCDLLDLNCYSGFLAVIEASRERLSTVFNYLSARLQP